MKEVRVLTRGGCLIEEARSLDDELVDELIAHFDRIDSTPVGFTKALQLLKDAVQNVGPSRLKFYGQKSTMHRAMMRLELFFHINKYNGGKFRSLVATILNKVIVKISVGNSKKRTSSGTFVCLLNKLKPTNDGKDDSKVNNKASITRSFFINAGVKTHDRFKNQAFA